jgi:hypothetical protein
MARVATGRPFATPLPGCAGSQGPGENAAFRIGGDISFLPETEDRGGTFSDECARASTVEARCNAGPS